MSDYHRDNSYPPGWDCKYDQNTGKCYYINYITKAMTIDDPRPRYRLLQNERASMESIPMQPVHGSPYHVYPANNYPAIQAFQAPSSGIQSVSASPLLTSRIHQMEMVNRYGSPVPSRILSNAGRSTIQETSFITPHETDAVVSKINTMFPTASDAHIRLLLKKYMKSIYPKADEALILDVLANSDNNVQRASERLKRMGYEKRDMTAPKVNNRQPETPKKSESEVDESERVVPLKPKERTPDEKAKIKCELQEKYQNVAERIITMALESVEYSEEKASQILEIVLREDEVKNVDNSNGEEGNEDDEDKDKVDGSIQRVSVDTSILESVSKCDLTSVLKNTCANGTKHELAKGPNDEILLLDYMTWNGANPDNAKGRQGLNSGPNNSLLSKERNYKPKGTNSDLCKGPKSGLAKGSIYSQLSVPNVKCN